MWPINNMIVEHTRMYIVDGGAEMLTEQWMRGVGYL